MMHVECENKLVVRDATPKLRTWCRENLRLPNPDFYKKQAMGKWTGNTPEYFDLYETIGKSIYLPFGCARRVYEAFRGNIAFKAVYSPLRRVDYKSNINLYPYQEAAVRAAQELKNGIIVMPCGSGKTQTALELISRIGGRTLWLTHTHDLLYQSLNRAKSVLDVYTGSYGVISGGKVNIGQGITFATVQTMAKLDLAQYWDTWDVIIVDECHKAVGSPTKVMQFYKVLSSLSCRYKYGLTATPKRADGLTDSMFALLGDVVYEVSREQVANTTCRVEVERVQTTYSPNMDAILAGDGTLNYAALVNDMTGDQDRFHEVLSRINGLKKMLVLANRVSYLEQLSKAYEGKSICLSGVSGYSKAAKVEREKALKNLNKGKIDCIFATYQLAKEGLDVPSLEYVVFATPEKDETTVTQAAGRVGRKSPGKQFGTVIDFVDDFGMLRGWAKKRAGFYKKLKYDIL